MLLCYKTLGVHRGATLDEIKAAYYALAAKLHPDTPNGNAGAFAEVAAAWRGVNTAPKRALYHTMLILHGALCPKCHGQGFTRKSKGFAEVEKTGCDRCSGEGVLL